MIFDLPLRTKSEANQREHWRAKAARTAEQRRGVTRHCQALRNAFDEDADLEVVLTRIAPRQLDEDNLAGSFKAVQDAVANLLERDDRPGQGVEWVYRQEKGAPREYAVRVEVQSLTLDDRIARARWHLAELEAQRGATA